MVLELKRSYQRMMEIGARLQGKASFTGMAPNLQSVVVADDWTHLQAPPIGGTLFGLTTNGAAAAAGEFATIAYSPPSNGAVCHAIGSNTTVDFEVACSETPPVIVGAQPQQNIPFLPTGSVRGNVDVGGSIVNITGIIVQGTTFFGAPFFIEPGRYLVIQAPAAASAIACYAVIQEFPE